MNEVNRRTINRSQRANRVRSKITGSAERPRLTVRISNNQVYAQLIDDEAGKTILAASSLNQSTLAKSSLNEKATWVGEDIGKKAKTAKFKQVVFDRGHKSYQGRIKSVADAARKQGLEF